MELPQLKNPYEILQAGYAHTQGIYGRNVTVAVIDTGIFPHEDFYKFPAQPAGLQKQTLQSRYLAAPDFIRHRKTPYDNSGHGTHIAGIIGSAGMLNGHFVGIAPGCNLVSVRILDGRGNGNMQNMLEGIYWILEHRQQYHIRIANISIGTVEHIPSEKSSQLSDAVEAMWDAGIIVVAAAGNRGPKRGSVTVPGTCPKVITVGASDDYRTIPMDGIMIKDYSGRGPTKNCIVKPEILAPGSHIVSCKNARRGYVVKSGTSMSTPFVSGAIALLLEKYPAMTNKDVKLALYQTAKRLNFPKEQQGWGLLNIPALLSLI